MTLLQSTLLLSLMLAVFGIFFLRGESSKQAAFKFLRSKNAAYVLYGLGGLWFVWQLFNLGQSDFGDIKHLLILLFGGAWLLSFKHLPDFLSVRGLCVVLLLLSRVFLDSAYMLDIPARYTLVSITYAVIVATIYTGCLPYRLRDFFEWLYAKKMHAPVFGAVLIALAAALDTSIIFY